MRLVAKRTDKETIKLEDLKNGDAFLDPDGDLCLVAHHASERVVIIFEKAGIYVYREADWIVPKKIVDSDRIVIE